MAKVIGFDPQLLRQCKCRKCTATIEYALNEVKSFVRHDYDGGSDTIHYIHCPNCNSQVQDIKHY